MSDSSRKAAQPAVGKLRKRAEFLRVRSGAIRIKNPNFLMQAAARERVGESAHLGIGLTITKKIGNAAARNRVKRRLKEALRLLIESGALKGVKGGYDIVLIAHPNLRTRKFDEILSDLRAAFDALAERTRALRDSRNG